MEHAPPIETAVYSPIRSRPGGKTEQWDESEEIVEVTDDDDGAGHGHFQNNFLKKSVGVPNSTERRHNPSALIYDLNKRLDFYDGP